MTVASPSAPDSAASHVLPAPLLAPGRVLAIAVSLGGGVAAVQVLQVLRIHYVRDAFAWVSRDVFWMAPTANAFVLCVLGLVLWMGSRAAPRVVRPPLVYGMIATVAVLAVLLQFGGLHSAAVVALSIGIGAQGGRLLASPRSRVRRFVIGGGLCLAALLLGGALWERLTRDGRSAPAVSLSMPSEAPNVLVIVWDTVRAMSVSLYGSRRNTTPGLERLAARGTTFEWAMAPSPWTLPSHCSMFTGLQPGEHSCRWDDPLRGAPTTVAAEFAKRGWRTGAFVANLFYTTHETGLEQGFAHFSDFQVTWRQVLLASPLTQTAIGRDLIRGGSWGQRFQSLRQGKLRGDPKPLNDRKLAATATDEFLTWQARDPGRPFFAFLNLFDAHDPYDPPPPWNRAFPDSSADLGAYEGAIGYMDSELTRVLGELERRGVLENTVVVVTSDHGEAFGEHRLFNHGHALYMPLLHVPLVIHAPGRLRAGARVSSTVPLRDLAATLLDLAGIAPVVEIGGSSFVSAERIASAGADSAAWLRGVALAETERSKLFWGRGPARNGAMHSVIDDSLHYIIDAKGTEELFAYRVDTAERRNLAQEDTTSLVRYRAALKRVTRRLVP